MLHTPGDTDKAPGANTETRWIESDDIDSSSSDSVQMPVIDINHEIKRYLFPNTKDYSESILNRYRMEDNRRRFNPHYLTEVQKALEEKDRNVGVAWMIQSGLAINLSDDAIFLAVRILDYYLGISHLTRNLVQLACASALLLGAKTEDPNTMSICSGICLQAVDISEQTLTDTELLMFRDIEFNIVMATPIVFLHYYLKKFFIDNERSDIIITDVIRIVRFISYCALSFDSCSKFNSEHIALIALYLTSKILNFPLEMSEVLNFTDAKSCLIAMKDAALEVLNNTTSTLTTYFKITDPQNIISTLETVADNFTQ